MHDGCGCYIGEFGRYDFSGDDDSVIAEAIGSAAPDDAVLILGKGHELGQEIAGTVHPFDDREVARELVGAA